MNGKQKHIVCDTTFLRAIGQHPDWMNILKKSHNGEIVIHMPYIVLEEWRSKLRDELVNEAANLQKAITSYNRKLSSHLLLPNEPKKLLPDKGFVPMPCDFSFFEELTNKQTEQFLERYNIDICHITGEHSKQVFKEYFTWQGSFLVSETNRTDDKTRDNRRKNLPDAFICAAIVEVAPKYDVLYFLIKDDKNGKDANVAGQIKNNLNISNVKIITCGELLNIIEPTLDRSKKLALSNSAEELQDNNTAENLEPEKSLSHNLLLDDNGEPTVSAYVLVYISIFTPVPVDDLANLVNFGFKDAALLQAANEFVKIGALERTEHYYLFKDSNLSDDLKSLFNDVANILQPIITEGAI